MQKIQSYFQNINMVFTKKQVSIVFMACVLSISIFFNLTGVLKANEISWQEEAQTNLSTLREQAKFLDQEEIRVQKEKQSNRLKRECYSKKLVSETPQEFLCEESFK